MGVTPIGPQDAKQPGAKGDLGSYSGGLEVHIAGAVPRSTWKEVASLELPGLDMPAPVRPDEKEPFKPAAKAAGRPAAPSASATEDKPRQTAEADAGDTLRVMAYLQDPSMSDPLGMLYFAHRALGLSDGPTSARIAVVDWDADKGRLEEPVGWDAQRRRFFFWAGPEQVPLTVEQCDRPQYHQVNAWAVIQTVLQLYEEPWVLGRAAPWAFEGNRLIVVPHAGYLDNAFYDRQSKSIQFYYFDGGGRRCFTCLSHDIIAHETGHAILDGMRPLYHEDSSLETTAFHEFVADLTAIMAALLNNQVRWKVAQETGGHLSRDRTLSYLAEEFGWSAAGRPYLRSAQQHLSLADVAGSLSPHDRSQVLTGAMFQILKGMASRYLRHEPGRQGATPDQKDAGSDPQLIERVLRRAADRFRRTALQPLDYLPPVDVDFGDYCRAVLRADEVADPADRDRFRPLMEKVFAARGIALPEAVVPEALRCVPDDIDTISRSRTDAYLFLNRHRAALRIPAEHDISVTDLYQTDKGDRQSGMRLPREIVLQYTWREDVELRGPAYGALDGETTALLCGGTLVFDGRGNLLHWARKPGTGQQDTAGGPDQALGCERRARLLEYVKARVACGQVGLVEGSGQGEVDTRRPVVARRAPDGVLAFEVPPHLRDARRG